MSSLEIRAEPSSMGFDAARLERIQSHFDAYVADRRLPGWLATVSRGGELVWTGKGGHRDREFDLPASDVLGHLVELWSGQTLDVFFRERILAPLGMHDTEWWCPEEKQDRLAMLYVPYEGDSFRYEDLANAATRPRHFFDGGSGLLRPTTTSDS